MNMRTTQFDSVNVSKLLLEKIEIGISERLPGHYLQDSELSVMFDYASLDIIAHFRAFLYGQEEVTESDVIEDYLEFPTDWIQVLRGRFLPCWWLEKHPVKTDKFAIRKKIVKKITKVCPHLNVKSDRKHLEFFYQKGIPDGFDCNSAPQ